MTAQSLDPTSVAAARRPIVVTVALVLMVLAALSSLVPAPGTEEIPQFILISAYVLAFLKLVAAVGLWRCHRWAAILGFVAVLLDGLTAVPGAFFAPTVALQLLSTVGTLISIVILVLLVLPAARRAYR